MIQPWMKFYDTMDLAPSRVPGALAAMPKRLELMTYFGVRIAGTGRRCFVVHACYLIMLIFLFTARRYDTLSTLINKFADYIFTVLERKVLC